MKDQSNVNLHLASFREILPAPGVLKEVLKLGWRLRLLKRMAMFWIK